MRSTAPLAESLLSVIQVTSCCFFISFIPACKTDPQERSRTVVQIIAQDDSATDFNATIDETEFHRALALVRLERDSTMSSAPLAPELREAIIEQMIDGRLLRLEAELKGVKASTVSVEREIAAMRAQLPDYEKQLIQTYQTETDLKASIQDRLTASLLLKQEAFARISVSEDDVRQLWSSVPESEKNRPARVHAAQIVVRTEDEGKSALKALKEGSDFGALARKISISPEATQGGDLGWFERGVMPTVFDETCFALTPGRLSELTPSEYGFHIFKLLEAEEPHPISFEESRAKLLERLLEERMRRAEAGFMENLRRKVKVVKNENLISQLE